MARNDVPKNVRCSFCGKSQDSVKKNSCWTRCVYL